MCKVKANCVIVQTKRWDVGLTTLQVPASAPMHDKHYGGKNVTIRNQPSCRNHPNSWLQPLCFSALRSPLSFRVAYRFAAFVGMFPLSDFTPHLAVSASEETVSETGVSRCRQLTATVKPRFCNARARWKNGSVQLFFGTDSWTSKDCKSQAQKARFVKIFQGIEFC